MESSKTVRAVVLDYKAVFRTGTTTTHPGVAELLHWTVERGLSWVLLTNNPFDAAAACAAAKLPAPRLHLTRDDIPERKGRGSGLWLTEVATRLGLRHNQLLMVGTTKWDWLTGINAHTLFTNALWAKAPSEPFTALQSAGPDDVRTLLEHFLLVEPEWAFRLDDEDKSFQMRSLLLPDIRLGSSKPSASFKLQDVFTRDGAVEIADWSAREYLMLQLLCSAYLDGTLPGGTRFAVYPSSTPGKVSAQIGEFLERAKVVVGSHYKPDLLERVAQAPDTSLERWKAREGRPAQDVSIATQARTVRVNPKYRGKLDGATVIVFDDFTTAGMSLDWARTLLTEAGAGQVIALTIGKYRKPHTHYIPRPGTSIDPFEANDVTAAHFDQVQADADCTIGPEARIHASVQHILAGTRHVIPATGSLPKAPAAGPERTVPELPFNTARERDLGEQLAKLQDQGLLTWVWDGELDNYWDDDPGPMWWIRAAGHADAWYDIDAAEQVVSAVSATAGIPWKPAACDSSAYYGLPPGTLPEAIGRPAPLGGRMWPRPPYASDRERHLGEQLDQLQLQRRLKWLWSGANVFTTRPGGDSGSWWIAVRGQESACYEIEEAERIASAVSVAAGLSWKPAAVFPGPAVRPPAAGSSTPRGRLLPMPPYRIARQRHLGEQLGALQDRGLLTWRGSFVIPPGKDTTTALWWITLPGQAEQLHETKAAEDVVSRMCAQAGIVWEPVAHPGGERQLAETLKRIKARRALQA
ncbi:hypothetical protein ACFRMQ_11135 [Kitasatospora sp. NPDC056783]|uniref:hypothetical protein n=1 Tax=Kitasatospora sp. NPDC056783 TaxID=3345943 RepID=UPI0036CC6894